MIAKHLKGVHFTAGSTLRRKTLVLNYLNRQGEIEKTQCLLRFLASIANERGLLRGRFGALQGGATLQRSLRKLCFNDLSLSTAIVKNSCYFNVIDFDTSALLGFQRNVLVGRRVETSSITQLYVHRRGRLISDDNG